jgi:enoyl-CoA hydratase
MTDLVGQDRRDHVLILTLNRPQAANALSPELLNDLGAALQDALDDNHVRVLVLTGAGERHFCAGMDLNSLGGFDRGEDGPPQGAEALADFMHNGTYAKPVVAAVNGAAVGGGLELAMSCDVVIAAEHARFGLPEVKRGLFPAGGGTLLSTRIAPAFALEYALTGRLFDALRAAEIGLVNHVAPASDVLDRAVELAEEIAANGPIAVQVTKRLLRAAVTVGPEAGRASSDDIAQVFQSADAREGATAFVEKRPAKFTGS